MSKPGPLISVHSSSARALGAYKCRGHGFTNASTMLTSARSSSAGAMGLLGFFRACVRACVCVCILVSAFTHSIIVPWDNLLLLSTLSATSAPFPSGVTV
eukprot:1157823-Pelagomonas_calceolata.AAC.7